MPFYGAAGALSGDADLTFTAGDTLTATKIGAFTVQALKCLEQGKAYL